MSSLLTTMPSHCHTPIPTGSCSVRRELKIDPPMIRRFWDKVEKSDGCWNWKASKNKQGYGRFGIAAGQSVNAHRVSYAIANGPIPIGLFICHVCDNPSCVNPDHLFAGTRQDNIDDMMIKKRSRHFSKQPYYGVQWQERTHEGPNRKGRWRSMICVNGKMKHLGYHTSLIEAARNYDRIAYIVYGERRLLNFIEEYNPE
jgi:hypothetical protein